MGEAQRTVGLHFAQGHEVWQLCREIATGQLDEDDNLDADARALSKERALRELFCAQMQLPLAENDLVMSEFRAWNTYNTLEPDEEQRRAVFDEAETAQTKTFAQFMKKLKSFEQAIAAGSQDPAEAERAWVQYINYVVHRIAPLLPASTAGTPGVTGVALVVCLFERAVAALCLYPTIWTKYMEYVAVAPDSDDIERRLELCRRAVRNVSFDSTAWVELLLTMEQSPACSHESIVAFVENDLLTRTNPLVMDQYHFLNMLLTFCDISRRHAAFSSPSGQYSIKAMETTVDAAFATSGAFLTRVFPDFAQGASRLYEYHAKLWLLVDCNAAVKKQKWQSRWQQIMAIRGPEAEAWATFYQESTRASALGLLTTTEIRATVFEEGLKQVKDYPLSVAELWVAFERERGDLESFLRARRRRSALAVTATALTVESASATSSGSTSSKRKLSGADDANHGNAKRSKHTHKEQQQQQRQSHKQDNKGHMEQQKSKPKPAAEDRRLVLGPFTNDNTLFVCNLSKEATEEDLKALFADIPSLKDVRLVVKMRGDRAKSRGMAYVQFTDASGVDQGLSRDGQVVHGQPISVKRSEPPSTSSSSGDQQSVAAKSKTSHAAKADQRDGTWKTDPRTIYVGGLNGDKSEGGRSVDVTDDEALAAAMTRAMEEAGESSSAVISRVCILKDKHGRPKNYGLVELGDADQVAKCLALIAHVQAVLGSNVTMKPSRFSIGEILEQQQQQKASKGPPKSADTRMAKPKGKKTRLPDAVAHERPSQRLALPAKAVTTSATSMSLMPRALRRKKEPAASSTAAATTPASGVTGEAKKPMTNDDFRQLLMKK